jgi:hypothetical protein
MARAKYCHDRRVARMQELRRQAEALAEIQAQAAHTAELTSQLRQLVPIKLRAEVAERIRIAEQRARLEAAKTPLQKRLASLDAVSIQGRDTLDQLEKGFRAKHPWLYDETFPLVSSRPDEGYETPLMPEPFPDPQEMFQQAPG